MCISSPGMVEILVIACMLCTVWCQEAELISDFKSLVDKFATKTTYAASFDRRVELTVNSESETEDRLHCKPAQVIALYRHGIRYPSEKDINKSRAVLSEFQRHGVRKRIVDELDAVLHNLSPPANTSYANLAPNGCTELFNLGYRLGRKYHRLFGSVDKQDVSYISSSSPRAYNSSNCFSLGFKKAAHQIYVPDNATIRDDLLRFFQNCSRYSTEVKKNGTALIEYQNFLSKILESVVRHIARRLDIHGLKIDEKHLFSVYQLAAIEYAVLNTSHWAKLLRHEDVKALEYAADLQEYWKMGYGYPIDYEISCPLVSDMFHHMDKVVRGDRYQKGVFYFGHAESVVPVLAALGLFNDSFPLRAADYNTEFANRRQFCTSWVAPFAVNVAFVLRRCCRKSESSRFMEYIHRMTNPVCPANTFDCENYVLEVIFNEVPSNFPFASHHMWPYCQVREVYAAYIDRCNMQELCYGN